MPAVLRWYPNVKLFVVGKSLNRAIYERFSRIRREFPDRVFMISYMDKQELFQYYYMSDIYMNTSLSESFSLSTHESALCGNALLLNQLPVFEKFRNKVMFFSDIDHTGTDFYRAYSALIESSSLRKRLAHKASVVVREHMAQNNLSTSFSNFLSLCG